VANPNTILTLTLTLIRGLILDNSPKSTAGPTLGRPGPRNRMLANMAGPAGRRKRTAGPGPAGPGQEKERSHYVFVYMRQFEPRTSQVKGKIGTIL